MLLLIINYKGNGNVSFNGVYMARIRPEIYVVLLIIVYPRLYVIFKYIIWIRDARPCSDRDMRASYVSPKTIYDLFTNSIFKLRSERIQNIKSPTF